MSLSGIASDSTPGNARTQPKQIRFVPSNGLPHAKRRRINAACQTCRRRKTRCSGERPVCKTCTDNGHACFGYAESANHPPKVSRTQASDEDDGDSSSTTETSTFSAAIRAFSPKPALPTLPRTSSLSPLTTHRSPATVPKYGSIDPSEEQSPASTGTTQSNLQRNRVPYFRYFGPTAIVPGYKQMVFRLGPRPWDYSSIGESPSYIPSSKPQPGFGKPPSQVQPEPAEAAEIAYYTPNDLSPVSALVKHLCELFFTHLGCNYPFLQRERFIRDLEGKCVDAILVDAVCALGARFSDHPLLKTPNEQTLEVDDGNEVQPAFRGQHFTQRAMSAVIDTFAYPTVAVVQACLLLAYDEFGSNHDSGLWMYLGLAIRMVQDIGMHKLEGLLLEGRVGPTPKIAKKGLAGSNEEIEREQEQRELIKQEEKRLRKERARSEAQVIVSIDDRQAHERERIDTFYAVFFLDRVVSSGTGRPVTLRDKDIEISFPFRSEDVSANAWPAPFPPMIRIIHIYGRAADVLNSIKEIQHVTPETLKRLASMEKDLTGIYQRLSPKLHFNAVNFQHYVKAGQGTNFILLHFWFHALIVLLHQPTLLNSFGDHIQQLFPDSRELSISSAKTIADILAFAELIDAKSFIGNPFTTQPIYIAACAFLAEIVHCSSSSPTRSTTPQGANVSEPATGNTQQAKQASKLKPERFAKHTLLASAANQNYQRCYKALKSLERYWAGTRYILTALDQKSKGIMDPLLYTSEDVESAIEMPKKFPAFTSPGWRGSLAHNHSVSYPRMSQERRESNASNEMWPPNVNGPIGWSLTGTMNSPNPNLSLLYSAPPAGPSDSTSRPTLQGPGMGQLQSESMFQHAPGKIYQHLPQSNTPGMSGSTTISSPLTQHLSSQHTPQTQPLSDVDLLLNLNSPSSTSSRPKVNNNDHVSHMDPHAGSHVSAHCAVEAQPNPFNLDFNQHLSPYTYDVPILPSFADTLSIEAQDINLNVDLNINNPGYNQLNNINDPPGGPSGGYAFSLADRTDNDDSMLTMIPWLEYLPSDVLNYFHDPTSNYGGTGTADHESNAHEPPAYEQGHQDRQHQEHRNQASEHGQQSEHATGPEQP